MFPFIFSQFNLSLFSTDWSNLPELKPATRQFLQGLPVLGPSCHPVAMQYYVDGSYFAGSGKCGWAIVAIGLHEGLWKWVGHVAVKAEITGSPHTFGTAVHSVFETELAAMAYAMAFCLGIPVPSTIGYDSTSAQAVATASCFDQAGSDLAQVCRSLQHLLHLIQRVPAWFHIRSHTGHPLNELADSAAKAGAIGDFPIEMPACLHEAQTSEVLPWLWTCLRLHPAVPAPLESGALPDAAAISDSSVNVMHMRPDPGDVKHGLHFRFRAVTYNCLTLQSVAQQESLCKQFHERGAQIVGLQETRTSATGRGSNEHFYVLHSPGQDGQLGCQLWLAKTTPVARAEGQPVFWDPTSLCIVHTEPRVLLAVARAGTQTFSFVVAHCPTSAAGAAVCEAWWDSLHKAVRRLPCNSIPLLLLDANAHNHDPEAHCLPGVGISANQRGFASFVRSQALRASGFVDIDGALFYTWFGPGGQKSCIDYVCCPQSISSGMLVEGPMMSFVGYVSHDHKPVAVTFKWKQGGHVQRRLNRLNTEVLHTAAGQAALRQVYNSMPPISWDTSVDDHLRIVNDHLHQGLQRVCPKLADRPRDPVTSEYTWELIKDRRRLRRHMHRVGAPAEWQDYLAFLGEQVRALTRRIRSAAKQDVAESLRRSFATARSQGTEALHRLCRRVTKAGRRYRAPMLCPALQDDEGRVVEDSFKILGEHFADAERASSIDAEAIVTRPASYAEQDFPVATCLSVAGLARAFSGLTVRKAAGWTTLPAEAYQAAPLEAAHHHVAIVLKCQLRRQCPIAWRGGLAAAIPKPSKPPHTTAGWRSILLLEAGAKGIAKALRQDLLRAFDSVRQPAQGGSRPGNPLQIASAHVRGLVRRIRASKKCGGILSVDGQAAFYSLLREAILGSDACASEDFLRRLAEDVFPTEDARLRFLVQATGPGLLECSGVPTAVRRFIAANLDHTWYGIGGTPTHFFRTRSGTVPGAPLADLLFQLVFGQVLGHISEESEHQGIRPLLPGSGDAAAMHLPAPSWMDDVAFPLISEAPDQLLQQASSLVQIVEASFRAAGVRLNFTRGKTEFLPIIVGRHSQQLRKQWLCAAEPTFRVQTEDGPVQIHLTERYTHLGSELDASGLDTIDITRRRHLARELLKAISRLVRNPNLSPDEKLDLVVNMPLTRLRHGAGLWLLQTKQERKLYNLAYAELLRRTFRAICGFSSRGLDDAAICACLGALSSAQARTADVLRHASWLIADGSPIVKDLWFDSGTWHQEVLDAIWRCGETLGCHSTFCWDVFVRDPTGAKGWARRYARKCRDHAKSNRQEARQRWGNFAAARDAGAIFVHFEGKASRPVHFRCATCQAVCSSAASLAAHQRKVHGKLAIATEVASGSRCEACGTEFWSTARLRDHLRRQKACLAVWAAADVVHTEETPASSRYAWRPACRSFGPSPWWATLRPPAPPTETFEQPSVALEVFTGWLPSACSEIGEAQVHRLVEFGVKHELSTEDMPLAVLQGDPRRCELAQCAIFVAQHFLARSAGSCALRHWRAIVRDERAVIEPVGLTLPRPLPGVWEFG